METNDQYSYEVIGAAIEVHSMLGPGLLESAYQCCLHHELVTRNVPFKAQKAIPLKYKGTKLDCSFRMDFFVADYLIIEIKVTNSMSKIHHAQILTYMKLTNSKVGLLINFNSVPLKNGIRRLIL